MINPIELLTLRFLILKLSAVDNFCSEDSFDVDIDTDDDSSDFNNR